MALQHDHHIGGPPRAGAVIWICALVLVAGISFLATRGRKRVATPEEQASTPLVQTSTAPAMPPRIARLVGAELPDRIAAAREIATARDAEAVPVILELLDERADRRGRTAAPPMPDELRQALIDALGAIGAPAADAICRRAIDGECAPRLEDAAAQALAKMGPPATKPLCDALLRWQVFTDADELKRWVEVLGRIGDAGAIPALNRALGQRDAAIDAAVADARRQIEARIGSPLPPAKPDGPLAGAADASLIRAPQREPLRISRVGEGSGTLPADGVLRLELSGAVVRHGGAGRCDLEMELYRRDGKWLPTLRAYALDYNKRDHDGRLVRSADGPPLSLEIDLLILSDAYVRGGSAELQIELTPGDKGFSGRYRGHSNNREVTGAVSGSAWPQRWDESPAAAAPGEHPRLLFRCADLPALRERATTPQGRAVLAALRARLARSKLLYHDPVNNVTNWQPGMDAAIGHGFLFSVFGDESHGRRAADYFLPRCRVMPYQGEHGERWPAPLTLMPFGHDLVVNALNPTQRAEAHEGLKHSIAWISPRYGLVGALAGGRPPGCFGPPGAMAVSLLREKHEFDLPDPEAPLPARAIDPPADLSADGAPINDAEPGVLIRRWLIAGPFPLSDEQREAGFDPLSAIGGPATRPRDGATVQHRGQTLKFAPLPESAIDQMQSLDGKTAFFIRTDAASPDAPCYLYCLLKAAAPLEGMVNPASNVGSRWAAVWISGQRIAIPSAVRLNPGLHSLLIRVDRLRCMPAIVPGDFAAAQSALDQYARLRDAYSQARARHARDGYWPSITLYHDLCRRGMRNWLWHQADQARATGQCSSGGLEWPYISAAWVAGEQFIPDTPLPLAHVPPERWRTSIGDRHLLFAWRMAPPALRPKLASEFRARFTPEHLAKLDCLELAAAYVNWPVDGE